MRGQGVVGTRYPRFEALATALNTRKHCHVIAMGVCDWVSVSGTLFPVGSFIFAWVDHRKTSVYSGE